MKIALVNYHHLNSNSGLHIIALARELTRLSCRCAVYVPNGKSIVREVTDDYIEVYDYADLSKSPFVPDLIHAWTPRECVRKFVETMVERYHCPYVIHLEDNEEHLVKTALGLSERQYRAIQDAQLDVSIPDNFAHPKKYREFLSRAIGVTALIDKLLDFCPVGKKSLVFWPSFDSEFAALPLPNEQRKRELGITNKDTVIVYTGNAHAANRDEVFSLYLAVGVLNRKGIPVRLIRTGMDYVSVIPEGCEELQSHCGDLGFVARGELPAVLALANILVQPGRPDAFNEYRFPSKLPEFLISGRPVILPKSNIGHVLEDGVECLLLDRGGAIEIATLIEQLIRDEERARSIGAAGKAFAESNFSWERNAYALREFYGECVKKCVATNGKRSTVV